MFQTPSDAAQQARIEYRQQLGRIFEQAMMAGDAVYAEAKRLAFEEKMDIEALSLKVHELCKDAAGAESARILAITNTTKH